MQVIAIEVELTNRGLEAVNDVAAAVFSYLAMVRDEGIPSYIINEAETVSNITWTFRENAESGDVASIFASNMQDFPPNLYLSGAVRIRGVDAKDVVDLFSQLTPDTVLVCALAPSPCLPFSPPLSLSVRHALALVCTCAHRRMGRDAKTLPCASAALLLLWPAYVQYQT